MAILPLEPRRRVADRDAGGRIVVIGVGGYSSGPVDARGGVRGVPTMLLEQNAVPGLTNRLARRRLVRAAAVTFESTALVFRCQGVRQRQSGPGGVLCAGGLTRSADARHSIARILVFGGSQGAHAINVAMVAAAARAGSRIRISVSPTRRGTGCGNGAHRPIGRRGFRPNVEPFLFDMGRQLARSGRSRLSRRCDHAGGNRRGRQGRRF